MIDWQRDVRARLEAGETITGGQIRREQGRRVEIYTFLQRLEQNEGWVFEKKLRDVDGVRFRVTHYRLLRKKRVKPPSRSGPRTDMAERPTDVAIARLLAGEEVEGIALARELGVHPSVLTYAKHRLEEQGYEFISQRIGYRVFHQIKGLRKTKKPRPMPPDRRTIEFGHFELRA